MNADTLKDKVQEPTAAEGTGSCRGREGEGQGEIPIGGSMVPLPGFRASGSLEMLLFLM